METSHFHPMVVHFPIALLIVGFVTDFVGMIIKKEKGFTKTGTYLLIIGVIGSLAAYLTGEFFTKEYEGNLSELKELHEIISKIAVFTAISVAVIRLYIIHKKKDNTNLKWFVFTLYFITVIFIAYSGYLGGSLVYDFILKT